MYFIGNCKDNIAALTDDDSVTEPLTEKMKHGHFWDLTLMLCLLVSWYRNISIDNTDCAIPLIWRSDYETTPTVRA